MKHTQPPWLVSPYKNVIDSQGCLIAQVELLPGDTGDEQIANAHLIAAAPELLSILQDLSEVCGEATCLQAANLEVPNSVWRHMITLNAVAVQVIKKARGEQ